MVLFVFLAHFSTNIGYNVRQCSTPCCKCSTPPVWWTMSETIEITRYPNRRLYDRSGKKYVTLGDIEAMVLEGRNVSVRDNKSDEDLTRVILMQILLERHPERIKLFPAAVLHEILRADQMALDWMAVYFGQAKSMLDGMTGTGFVPGMDLWKPFASKNAADVSPPTARNPADASTDSGKREQESQTEMADRLAALERRLKELEGKKD